jgi:aminoglycoside phosphotransferase (APT) family kinase protein
MDALRRILPEYGRLQRDLAPHVGEMLAAGVPDMRPAVMAARFDEALDAMRGYVERTGAPSDREALARVAALRETVTAWCEELEVAPGRPSLDHNDLHPWNILPGDGHARFYDWGDSVVAHPFASMLVGLGVTQSLVDEPEVEPLRDAYLEAFSDLAPHGELVATLELACRLGKVARALTWHRAIGAGGPDEVEPSWIRGPIESMVSLLDDSYLGRA